MNFSLTFSDKRLALGSISWMMSWVMSRVYFWKRASWAGFESLERGKISSEKEVWVKPMRVTLVSRIFANGTDFNTNSINP